MQWLRKRQFGTLLPDCLVMVTYFSLPSVQKNIGALFAQAFGFKVMIAVAVLPDNVKRLGGRISHDYSAASRKSSCWLRSTDTSCDTPRSDIVTP